MIELKPQTRTLICIGSGGVGKTTLSASIAVGQAVAGKKVLVLTIDPSMRLAEALGIKMDGEIHEVALVPEARGQLFAGVINHQKTFDWFIEQAARTENVEQLKQNKLYLQLSGRLSGSQDFTSLISLLKASESGLYDLVVLDTPPSQHTWNFLKAPEKIAALFNEGVASWFRQTQTEEKNLIQKFLNIGTTQVLRALETLTGSQFMRELSAFFKAIQTWQTPLENYVAKCHRLLTSPQTEFLQVTALDPSRLIEAEKLSREILKQGYQLSSIVINRVPVWTRLPAEYDKKNMTPRLQELLDYYLSLENDLAQRLGGLKRNLKIYKCTEMRQNTSDAKTLYQTYDQITSL